MLKSDFVLRQSAIRQLAFLMPLTAAGLALTALPYTAGTWLPAGCQNVFFYALVIATFFWQGAKACCRYYADKNRCGQHAVSQSSDILVETDGEIWHERCQGKFAELRLNTRRCYVMPFGLYLAFTSASGEKRYRWVLNNECEPLYYRRLVRLISA